MIYPFRAYRLASPPGPIPVPPIGSAPDWRQTDSQIDSINPDFTDATSRVSAANPDWSQIAVRFSGAAPDFTQTTSMPR
jgi:hypothetical protein